MIEASGLSKRYGAKTAVDDLSFVVRPGVVTGFLGPNGSGKSTTMRLLLGLDRPTAGGSLINGKRYADFPAPLREVGALLEARAIHTGRSARNHLLAMAATNGIPRARVDEVIGLVGLDEVAGKRAGGFSLGMGQRLGIASALLGDPGMLLLDEPVNGLDPEGILWIRNLLKALAAEGRTVFVSSHLMSEMAVTATELIVVGAGRLIAVGQGRGADPRGLDRRGHGPHRRGRPAGDACSPADGRHVERLGAGHPAGERDGQRGDRAGRRPRGIPLIELTPQQATLEEAFMEITRDAVEFHGGTGTAASPCRRSAGGRRDDRADRRRSIWAGPGHPAQRDPLRVDQAAVAALDLVQPAGHRRDHRRARHAVQRAARAPLTGRRRRSDVSASIRRWSACAACSWPSSPSACSAC